MGREWDEAVESDKSLIKEVILFPVTKPWKMNIFATGKGDGKSSQAERSGSGGTDTITQTDLFRELHRIQ